MKFWDKERGRRISREWVKLKPKTGNVIKTRNEFGKRVHKSFHLTFLSIKLASFEIVFCSITFCENSNILLF
jgi:hypothetical protein